MANRYTRALKQIKDKTLDEKLELLSEIPTNNAGGLYQDTPGQYVDPDPVQILSRGADLDQDGDGVEGYTGNDTTGLFLDDGTILIEEPPGDRSYVLGPMISMWYAWANYTQIGYVRQSDRRMVNLGRITGEMSNWDGSSGFTSYGQLTLEQAVWYKGQSRSDYRAFYPGPPSNEPDTFGRYIGSIVDVFKPTERQDPRFWNPGTQRGSDPTDNHSLAMDNMGGWLAAAAALGFVFNTVREFFNWWNRQNEEMRQKVRDAFNRDYRSQELRLQDVAGLRPDGTNGMNKLGDTNRGHDGTLYKLVPRPGYGYNMWVPVKKAGGGGPMVAHYEPKGKVLTESKKRVLRNVKKPVQVKEMPTKVKVSPKLRDKNKSVGVDMMKIPDTPAQYKPQTNIWGKADYAANVRASQEKKNEVLELVGAAEHHWTYLTEDRRRKHQEKVNEMAAAEYDKQMELLYEKHRIKENKLDKAISSVKKNNDLAPEGAPPPSKPAAVGPDGYHTKYGKNYKHDKLDPHSAEFMPPTGDPEIDANIKKATNAKEKARKLKTLFGKKTIKESSNTWSKLTKWRGKIDEGMTTAALASITLDGSEEVLSNELSSFDSSDAKVSSLGDVVVLGKSEGQPFTYNLSHNSANHTQVRAAVFRFDSTRLDTLVVNMSGIGGGEDSWCDPHCTYDNRVRYLIVPKNNPSGTNVGGLLYNGDNTISLPSSLNISDLEVHIYQYANDGEYAGGYNPPSYIHSINAKRRSPMNVFVPLDDPEASAFIRDTLDSQSLSPEEKKKKLEEQLGAGAEYLVQMFGEGIFTGATEISDVELQQSFVDMAQGLPYTDSDDAFDDPYYQGPPPDLDDDSDFDPDDFEYAGTNWDLYNWMNKTYGLPAAEWKRQNPTKPDASNPHLPAGSYVPKASSGTSTVVAHHEPQGKVIKEKKTLKDITKKIPGYYDGKPSPLGFPLEEPPKMKNGMHPDLVDGKKVSQRYNRLDPISAKSMPKTGNPHIDKKVRAAAKKPK